MATDEEAILQQLLVQYQLHLQGQFLTVRNGLRGEVSPHERVLILRLPFGDPVDDAPPWDRLTACGKACVEALNVRRVVFDISSPPLQPRIPTA